MAEPLKVGVAGLGTVGTAVIRLLERERDKLAARCGRPIEVVAVTARSRKKSRGIDLRKIRWAANPAALAADPAIDVFVEVIGGDRDPAKKAVETALAAGKAVVTANKALLARHGQKLAVLAERRKVALNFEASVGGAIPIVKTLREGLNGNSFARVYGILNGTCNYILSRMEQDRLAFADCLKDAQRLGYAEADPSFDVEGHDTAQKLSILASLAFGTKLDPAQRSTSRALPRSRSPISTPPMSSATASSCLASRVKTDAGIEQRVHPTMVPREFRDRPGHGRHQRGDDRRRGPRADHAGRPRRRRHGDGVGGGLRYRRCRARRAHRAVRTAGRAHDHEPQGADAAPRGRLLHPPAGARPARHRGDHRAAAGAAEHLAGIHCAAP